MKKREIGEYLFLFYRKKSTSFLANIYKASITADTRDIHRARLDVKKIFALYGLFDMVDPDNFRKNPGYKLFRPLYRQAGKIREAQVNLLLLSGNEIPAGHFGPFTEWICEEEKKSTRKFIQLVKDFREKDLKESERAIGALCRSSSVFRLRSKTMTYIRDHAESIHAILSSSPGDQELHLVRQNLKSMSTIATLVYSVKASKPLDDIITAINRTEIMIGDWHDRVVLKEAVEKYLREHAPVPENESADLAGLIQYLANHAGNLATHFIPEVESITNLILEEKIEN